VPRVSGRELRVRERLGKVGRRRLVDEADYGAVDVDAGGAIRCRLAGRGIDARDQVGPTGREVEYLHLVGLAGVQGPL